MGWERLAALLSDVVLVATSMVGMYLLATPKPGWRRLVPLLFYAFAAVNLEHPSLPASLVYSACYILLLALVLFSFEERWSQVYVLTFLLSVQQLLIHAAIMGGWHLLTGSGAHAFTAQDAAGFWRVVASNLLVVALFVGTIIPMRRLRFWKTLPLPVVWVVMAVDVVCMALDEIWKYRDGGNIFTPTPTLAWDILWAVLLFGVAAGLIAALVYRAQRRQLELMEHQLAHYHTLLDVWNETRSIRHDLENHLQTAAVLEERDRDEYLMSLRARIAESPRTEWCENGVLNAVLFNKTGVAEQAGVRLAVNAAAQARGIEGADLACVLANLLDNAIAASPHGGCVQVDIGQRGRLLAIRVENSVASAQAATSGRFLRPAKGAGHGVGLVAVRRTVARYSGTLQMRCENGVATVTATMLAERQGNDRS